MYQHRLMPKREERGMGKGVANGYEEMMGKIDTKGKEGSRKRKVV